MKNLVLFLNELSFTSPMSADEMLPNVLATLAAVRAVRRMRNDLVVAGQVQLGHVLLGDGNWSLAAILHGDRDEWRYLMEVEQSSPWDEHPYVTRPDDLQEVIFRGQTAVGMLWAQRNESAILSFAFAPDWNESAIPAQLQEMDHAGNINPADIVIPNMSNPNHIAAHGDLIINYGRTTTGSSLIYEGDGFVIRIWFNDHDPPHFHVLPRRDSSETLARCAIDTLDFLSGDLHPAIRRRVREWARERQGFLTEAWARCRAGQHPFRPDE